MLPADGDGGLFLATITVPPGDPAALGAGARTYASAHAEIERVKASHPGARYVGLADGAKGNWEFLGRHTEVQVIDFWHAAGYLSDAGDVLFASEPGAKKRLTTS